MTIILFFIIIVALHKDTIRYWNIVESTQEC